MFYYLACFTTSTFLFWFGDKIKKRLVGSRILVFGIAILIPSIIAGVRDTSVGTDVMVYAYPIFKDAYYSSNFEMLVNKWQRIEIGYTALNYIISRFTSNHNIFLGCIMFFEVLCTFIVLRMWRNKFPIWVGMLVFYFLFFNSSLNLMRQSLALSIAFIGTKYLFDRKLLPFVSIILLACLFHKSIIIFILYYPLYKYSFKFKNTKHLLYFIIIGILGVVVGQQVLAEYMSSLGETAARASMYITAVQKKNFPLNTLIFYSIPITLILYNKNRCIEFISDNTYFMQYIGAMLIFMPFLDFYGGVFAYRFFPLITWWLIILIPISFYSFRKENKAILNLAIIAYCSFFWYYNIIYLDANETANYLTIFQ